LPLIGKYNLIIDNYLENAVVPFNQFAGDTEILCDCIRQTGGASVKSSFHAINNPELYLPLLF